MSIHNLELSDGALRQRRNLFSVSLIMIFIEYGKVEFDSQLKIEYFSATIHNQNVISTFLMISLVYFLWRYYQYFASDQAHTIMKEQFRGALNSAMNEALIRKVASVYPSLKKEINLDTSYNNLTSKDFKYTLMFHASGSFDPAEGNFSVPTNITFNIFKIEWLRIPITIKFLFKKKIITDYYTPYFVFAYALYVKYIHSII